MRRILFIFLFFSCCFMYGNVPEEYAKEFYIYCNMYGVPTWIMSRLIEYESGWNPYVVNKNRNGSVDEGLCQLNSNYISYFERIHNGGLPINTFDWKQNMLIGIKHLRYLYDKTGSWWSAVAAYNMGYQGWYKWCRGQRPLPEVTKRELDFVFR